MRLIDADVLKEAFKKPIDGIILSDLSLIYKCIDSAPELSYEDGILSVENATRRAIELEEAYNNGWSDGFSEGENERQQGKWIFHKDYNESCRYGCNQCGNLTNIPGNFCPNCGSKMQKGGAE